jgi:hypothetical protein
MNFRIDSSSRRIIHARVGFGSSSKLLQTVSNKSLPGTGDELLSFAMTVDSNATRDEFYSKFYINGDLFGEGTWAGTSDVEVFNFDSSFIRMRTYTVGTDRQRFAEDARFSQFAIYDAPMEPYDVKKIYGSGAPVDITKYYMYPIRHLFNFDDPNDILKDSMTDLDLSFSSQTLSMLAPTVVPIPESILPQGLFAVSLPLENTSGDGTISLSLTATDNDGLSSTTNYNLNLIQFPLVGPTERSPGILVEEDSQSILSPPVAYSIDAEINVDGATKTNTLL